MRAVFIGGAGRSGTTLLGDLLGAHPDHICTPETSYKIQLARLGWGTPDGDLEAGRKVLRTHPKVADLGVGLPDPRSASLREVFDEIVRAYGARIGKPDGTVWIDHTPSNLAAAHILLREFEDSRVINVVRDGRAVAASTIPLDWGPNNVLGVAREWVLYIGLGLALETAYPDRVLRVRYEDLVRRPAQTLATICSFAGLEYRDDMVRGGGLAVPARDRGRQHALVGKPPDPARIDSWRSSLSQREIEIFESEVSSLLELLGYEPVFGARARDLSPMGGLVYDVRHLARAMTINRVRRRRRSGR